MITKGPKPPPALVHDLQSRIYRVARANAMVAPTRDGTTCEFVALGIELVAGEPPATNVAATVAGIVRWSVSRIAQDTVAMRTSTEKAVREARFALLYVRFQGRWSLVLSQFKSTEADNAGWQDLWLKESAGESSQPCLAEKLWRNIDPD